MSLLNICSSPLILSLSFCPTLLAVAHDDTSIIDKRAAKIHLTLSRINDFISIPCLLVLLILVLHIPLILSV